MVSWENIKKNEVLVMVVPRKKLFGKNNEDSFQGFLPAKISFDKGIDYISRVTGNIGFLTRGHTSKNENGGVFAESDEGYKQIIPYLLIINPLTKKVYAYKRGENLNTNHESRLHGNWSWGVGGHVDFQEELFKNFPNEFLFENLKREIEEEVKLENGRILNARIIGMINDDSESVGRVHFGIIYVVETDSTDMQPNDSESTVGKFLSFEEVKELVNDPNTNIDNWSKMLVDPLKELLR